MEDLDIELNEGLLKRELRVYRSRTDVFTIYADEELRKRFCFTQPALRKLLEILGPRLEPATSRSRALSAKEKLMLVLSFYASGEFQLSDADKSGVSQPSVPRAIAEVTDAIVALADAFIIYPTGRGLQTVREKSFREAHFPCVAGCVEGTHVRIQSPRQHEEEFVNWKNYHSLNVIAIATMDLHFTYVNSRWPGWVHDSRAFKESSIYADLQAGRVEVTILGDSAFALSKFLLKPLANPRTAAENLYNRHLCSARVCIENAFGALKRQFHCLHSELRYEPEKAAKLVLACCCLRNLAISEYESPFEDEEMAEFIPRRMHMRGRPLPPEPQLADHADGRFLQADLITKFFAR